MKRLANLAFGLGLALLALTLVLLILGRQELTGYTLLSALLLLALGIRRFPDYSNLTFTFLLLAGIALAMYWPETLLSWGGYPLKNLIVPLMQLIMFGVGTVMTPADFSEVAKNPRGVVIGLIAQFSIMPLVGYSLANAFNFPPEIAAGVVLIGCAPSGLASNVMCYIAKANVALSVSITTVATLLAPLLTPLLMKLLANQLIEVSFTSMMVDILKIVILPIGVGVLLNVLARDLVKRLNKILPLISMGGILFIVAIITATGRDSLLTVGLTLLVAVGLHNTFGYLLGYWGAKLTGLDEKSCRTVAIEVGLQNGGLASALALQMGKVATTGLAAAVFGPWMNTSGSILANWWRNRPATERRTAFRRA
jgi:BASS family bile acid:Na+ symporter